MLCVNVTDGSMEVKKKAVDSSPDRKQDSKHGGTRATFYLPKISSSTV